MFSQFKIPDLTTPIVPTDIYSLMEFRQRDAAWLAHAPVSSNLTIPGDSTTTETLSVGGTRFETLETDDDTDWFQLDLAANQSVSLFLFGYDHVSSNGLGALIDCNITIYDSAGNVVASVDPASANADYLGIIYSSLDFTATLAGTYYVEAGNLLQGGTGDYGIVVLEPEPMDPIPGNGTTTETVAVGETRLETLEHADDTDWFQLHLVANQSVSLFVFGYDHDPSNGVGAMTDCHLTIYDSSGIVVASVDPSKANADYLGITFSNLEFTASLAGTYFVETSSALQPGASDYGIIVMAAGSTDVDADAALIVGQYETGIYGNGFSGAIDRDGTVAFTFDAPETDVTLFVEGYDIDTSTEVEVLLNGQSIGHLLKSANNASQDSSFSISASTLLSGQNTVEFVQTSAPTYTWGVTDILVMGEGLHVSALPIDPEFSEDGYAAWQTDDRFYLGIIDPDTGAIREIVNEVDIRPTNIRLTHQGPEIIRTSTDGIGAIGVSPNGLVHYTENGATILDGTAGLRIGYAPKGETPGLRFTANDGAGGIYLYDNGVITPLDFGGGVVTSWLNESEVLVSYRPADIDQIGVYNFDTGAMDVFAQQTYGSPAHQAAYTASDGVQYLALTDETDYHELWRNDGNGWEFFRKIESTLPGRNYMHSPEFFEWQGHVFIAGVASSGPGASDAVPALYDIDSGAWSQLGVSHPIEEQISDPEILVLDDNSLAYYFSDFRFTDQYFFTTTYEEVLEAMIFDTTGNNYNHTDPDDIDGFLAKPVSTETEGDSDTFVLAGATSADTWDGSTGMDYSSPATSQDVADDLSTRNGEILHPNDGLVDTLTGFEDEVLSDTVLAA